MTLLQEQHQRNFLLNWSGRTRIWTLLQTRKTSHSTVGTSEGETGISHRRLIIIVIGLCLTIFLTALDQVRPSLIALM